jgi:GUN4-like
MASHAERLKEFFQKHGNLIFGTLVAPVVVGLIVARCQQNVIPPTTEVRIHDFQIQLENKEYPELVSLCAPIKNNSLKEADTQTFKSIGKMIYGIETWKRKERGYSAKSIDDKGICSQLKEIDELWKEVSKGKLGFSAQTKIWNKHNKKYMAFIKEVGWLNPDNTWKQKLSYSLDDNMSDGHLPALWNRKPGEPLSSGKQDYTTFFTIIEDCNI